MAVRVSDLKTRRPPPAGRRSLVTSGPAYPMTGSHRDGLRLGAENSGGFGAAEAWRLGRARARAAAAAPRRAAPTRSATASIISVNCASGYQKLEADSVAG